MPRKHGPAYLWSPDKQRELVRLYLMTPLDYKKIAAVLEDGRFHPKRSNIIEQLQKLLGLDYHHYHTEDRAYRNILRARVRCVKYDQDALLGLFDDHKPTEQSPDHSNLRESGNYQRMTLPVQIAESSGDLDFIRPQDLYSQSLEIHPEALSVDEAVLSAELQRSEGISERWANYWSPYRDTWASNVTIQPAVDPEIEMAEFWQEGDHPYVSDRQSYANIDTVMDVSASGVYESANLSQKAVPMSTQGHLIATTPFHRFLESGFRKDRFSMSSGVASLVSSLVRMSLASSARMSIPFSLHSSLQPSAQSSTEETEGKVKRGRELKSLLTKLSPTPLSTPLPRKLKFILTEIAEVEKHTDISSRTDVLTLRRKCCQTDLLASQFLPRQICLVPNSGNRILCRTCNLTEVHYWTAHNSHGWESSSWPENSALKARDHFKNSVLHFAAARDSSVFQGLLGLISRGAPVTAKNAANQNFLFALNPNGFSSYMGYAIDGFLRHLESNHQMDLRHRDVHGQTFLHCLLPKLTPELCSEDMLSDIFEVVQADIYALDNQGRSLAMMIPPSFPRILHSYVSSSAALHPFNANWQHLESTRVIGNSLDYGGGFDIRAIDTYDSHGDTPLTSFIKYSEKEDDDSRLRAIPYMIQNGANVHIRDRDGNTALGLATARGMTGVVRMLLAAGATHIIENYDNQTIFELARTNIIAANKSSTEDDVLREVDILCCIATIIDWAEGRRVWFKKHRDRDPTSRAATSGSSTAGSTHPFRDSIADEFATPLSEFFNYEPMGD